MGVATGITRLRGTLDGAAFRLRQRLRLGRTGYHEIAQPKADLFAQRENAPALIEAEAALLARYAMLPSARQRSRRARYLEILSILDALEQLWQDTAWPAARPLRWLDVGAKNWAYVDALAAFLSAHTDDWQLDGVELDPYRLYGNFYTRGAYAQAHAAPYAGRARYLEGDVRAHDGQYEGITLLLPFVFESTHRAWGLPQSAFQPQALLDHVIRRLLAPGGILLIVNQGEAEYEAQRALLVPYQAEHVLDMTPIGPLPPTFLPYRHVRFGWRCRRRVGV